VLSPPAIWGSVTECDLQCGGGTNTRSLFVASCDALLRSCYDVTIGANLRLSLFVNITRHTDHNPMQPNAL
jgi:hypothetical protein